MEQTNRPIAAIPSRSDAERCVREAQRLYRRALAAWACDLLELRRRGTIRTTWPAHDAQGEDAWSLAA